MDIIICIFATKWNIYGYYQCAKEFLPIGVINWQRSESHRKYIWGLSNTYIRWLSPLKRQIPPKLELFIYNLIVITFHRLFQDWCHARERATGIGCNGGISQVQRWSSAGLAWSAWDACTRARSSRCQSICDIFHMYCQLYAIISPQDIAFIMNGRLLELCVHTSLSRDHTTTHSM